MKPLIGITASHHKEPPNRDWLYNTADYFRAVQNAGGIPVLLPFMDSPADQAAILDRLDGLLLSGGVDVDPLLYGEEPHPKNGAITPERDSTELPLARAALERDMPTLGICRGHQILAVAAGGTLYQDIPTQVTRAIKHYQEAPRWYATHTVEIMPGTRLAELLGPEARVNTYHHQAVKALPAPWVQSAVAPDGLNEAMELPGKKFVLSVQWHPENMTGRSYNQDRLFTALVDAAKPTK